MDDEAVLVALTDAADRRGVTDFQSRRRGRLGSRGGDERLAAVGAVDPRPDVLLGDEAGAFKLGQGMRTGMVSGPLPAISAALMVYRQKNACQPECRF